MSDSTRTEPRMTWPDDQVTRFRRMIVAAQLIQREGTMTIKFLSVMLNDAYGFDVGDFALMRDVRTLEAIGLIKRPKESEMVFVRGRAFWPFGGEV